MGRDTVRVRSKRCPQRGEALVEGPCPAIVGCCRAFVLSCSRMTRLGSSGPSVKGPAVPTKAGASSRLQNSAHGSGNDGTSSSARPARAGRGRHTRTQVLGTKLPRALGGTCASHPIWSDLRFAMLGAGRAIPFPVRVVPRIVVRVRGLRKVHASATVCRLTHACGRRPVRWAVQPRSTGTAFRVV